jgi:hypothetical protein
MFYLPGALMVTLARHFRLSNDRLQTLMVLIVGLVNARTVNLSHITGAFPGPAKLESNYRRLQRFFQYVRLDEDWLAKALVVMLRLVPPYRLCLDRTNWKLGKTPLNLLVLCIVTKQLRIPILWTILDNNGTSTMAQRQALLERYLKLFGASSIRMLLADREFIGSQWFEFLVENDIPFAIRMPEHLLLVLESGQVVSLASMTRHRAQLSHLPQLRGRFMDMDERFAGTLGFAAKRRSDGTLIIVATNRDPLAALASYKKRWQIECLFGDTKTRGFNMEDTKLTQPAKLSLLFAVIALAIAWAQACAKAVRPDGYIPRAKHGYRRKSWFRTGLDTLRHWIVADPQTAHNAWANMDRRLPKRFYKPRVV